MKTRTTKKTYKALQEYVRAKAGRVMQSCWIADRKEKNGLRVNSRRVGERQKPCPPQYEQVIDSAMLELGWL
ncbi:hypothetical protein [Trinickia mobilis]|uniref:hypothetical protein n=1 Tax=Trinickia mobilis TaxID=2816356 RepID=UPI001A8DCC93|nr:hypothetical protein [Trinickia mobilis]